MDKRRRAGAIAASAAALSASTTSLTATRHGSVSGLSDFWIGAIIGLTLAIAMIAAALVVRSRGGCDCP